ncbi:MULTISPECIES: hypothetical protein [unclassified Haloferax]|uniref:DUF7263 family protein n=1 Tax=unclassified Haloferax TaxID=2625095 RepID=UPI0028752003|nr:MULTISPECIES: hypothetical protein [unclassified Haloferax]MDS0242115.1 hypothetical protein [Haloferax sp. S2CR25]MDS0445236.1 hypothetical protein [Haloferax sp. S2CR25-2]
MRSRRTTRAQTTLAGLAVALVLVTAVTVGAVAAADRALAGATGDSLEQQRAERAAAALLTDSPITWSDNGSDAIDLALANDTNATVLAAAVPPLRDAAFRVRIDGRTVAERGDPSGGATVSRGAVAVTRRNVRGSINLSAETNTTLTGRTNRTQLDVDPAPNTTVQTIRVGDRVVLHRPGGIEGRRVVGVPSRTDPVIRVETAGSDPYGTVDVSATAFDSTVVRIEVTVDA